jgi:hypothetical protein
MPLTSYDSKGTAIYLLDKSSSPVTESKIGGVNDIPSISSSKSTLEDTSIDDTNRHYKHGIGEPPEITLTVYWDPNNSPQNDLITAHQNESEEDFKIKCPDSPATEYEFKAIVTGFSTPQASVNELLSADFTMQLLENDHGEIVTKDPS